MAHRIAFRLAVLVLLPTAALASPRTHASVGERVVFTANGRGWFRQGVGGGPGTSMAAGDLNRDGAPDLVLPHPLGSQVLLNLGDGTFGAPTVFTGASPSVGWIALGDLNNDGKLDAVAGDSISVSCRVSLGNGDGTFAAPTAASPFLGNSAIVALGDMNCDGKLDIVAGAYGTSFVSNISVLLGNGDGTFGGAMLYPSPIPNMTGLTLADMNGDGMLDVVSCARGATNAISIYYGGGTGGFNSRTDLPFKNFGERVEVGDWDRDGTLDIAWLKEAGMLATALDGGFGAVSELVSVPAHTLGSGDFTRDGFPDLIVPVGNMNQFFLGTALGFSEQEYVPGWFVSSEANASMAIADFNRDGFPDVADDVGRVWFGRGPVSPAPAVYTPGAVLWGNAAWAYPNGFEVVGTRVAFINSDNLPDIIAADAGQVVVSLNAGGNIFTIWKSYPFFKPPTGLTTVDLTNDGKTDIAVAAWNGSAAELTVLVGGPQYPSTAVVTALPPTQTGAIEAADFNADGIKDVAITRPSADSLIVLLGVGNGTFGATVHLATKHVPTGLAVGDFNHDTKQDIVVSHYDTVNPAQSNVSLFPGNGNGTFGARIDLPTPVVSQVVLGADFNNDGFLDIVAGSSRYSPNAVGLVQFQQAGDGTYSTSQTLPLSAMAPGVMDTQSLDVADFDLDGLKDVVLITSAGDAYVMLGNGSGGFLLGGRFLTDAIAPGRSVAVTDIYADGRPDFVVLGQHSGRALLHKNLGPGVNPPASGVFASHTDVTTGLNPWDAVVADFNRDGKLDYACVANADSTAAVHYGNGSGGLGPATPYAVSFSPFALATGDLNEDGVLDLVSINVGTAIGAHVSVSLGLAGGGFQAPVHYPTEFNGQDIALSDLDRDGDLDVVACGYSPFGVRVFHGNGDGTLQTGRPYDVTGFCAVALEVADMNRDCIPDIVVVTGECSTIDILLGLAGGGYAPAVPYGIGDEGYALAVGDFNRDGNMDVVVPPLSGDLRVFPGTAAGTLGAPVLSPGVLGPQAIAAGDVNGDGKLDVAVTDNSNLTVFSGNGAGAFTSGSSQAIGGGRAVAMGDFSRDGHLDIVATRRPSPTDNLATILLNGAGVPTAAEAQPVAPRRTALRQNVPNPFNPSTRIRFATAQGGRVTLAVYDVHGRRVATLVDRDLPAGEHKVDWIGRDDAGHDIASGVYFYRLDSGREHAARKMVLMK